MATTIDSSTTSSSDTSTTSNTTMMKLGMRVFGLPYQFPETVDPRFSDVTSTIGRSYLNNIRLQAPILTIIPGNPYYLPGEDKGVRVSMGQNIIDNADTNTFKWLKKNTVNNSDNKKGDTVRYYDFTPAFQDYIQYVNIMLRTIAGFLQLTEKLDGVSFQQYNWTYYKDNETGARSLSGNKPTKSMQSQINKTFSNMYRYTETTKKVKVKKKGKTKTEKKTAAKLNKDTLGEYQVLYQTTNSVTSDTKKNKKYGFWKGTIKAVKDKASSVATSLYETVTNMQYVRFCVDPTSGFTENYNNETGTSMLKSAFDNGSDALKEVAFLINSGGSGDVAEGFSDLINSATESLSTALNGNNVTSILSRLLNLTGNVIKGSNVIMPDIYKSSSRPTTYTFTVHLKSPYGNKLGIYMDNLVPLMHLVCLAIPKQSTANTYNSPFLVKAFMDGVCNINLGMITDLQVNKSVSEQSWTVDGMPNEIDVAFTITDLYSDLAMSPQENPILFLNNTSLIEYLANTCGMSLVAPKISTKIGMAINTIKSRLTDVPQNITNVFQENISYAIRSITGF